MSLLLIANCSGGKTAVKKRRVREEKRRVGRSTMMEKREMRSKVIVEKRLMRRTVRKEKYLKSMKICLINTV